MAASLGGLIGFVATWIILFARETGMAAETIELLKKENPELVEGLTPLNTYLILNAAAKHWEDLQKAPNPVPRLDRLVHLRQIIALLVAGGCAAIGYGIDRLLPISG